MCGGLEASTAAVDEELRRAQPQQCAAEGVHANFTQVRLADTIVCKYGANPRIRCC
jgi:hypothetical protein